MQHDARSIALHMTSAYTISIFEISRSTMQNCPSQASNQGGCWSELRTPRYSEKVDWSCKLFYSFDAIFTWIWTDRTWWPWWPYDHHSGLFSTGNGFHKKKMTNLNLAPSLPTAIISSCSLPGRFQLLNCFFVEPYPSLSMCKSGQANSSGSFVFEFLLCQQHDLSSKTPFGPSLSGFNCLIVSS